MTLKIHSNFAASPGWTTTMYNANHSFSLAGKSAYITGAVSGIGRAVADRLIAAGATVVAADISDPDENTQAEGLNYVHVDVGSEQSVQESLQWAAQQNGKLDIVILNAGIGDVGPSIGETDQALLDKITRINQWGVLYGLKHAPVYMNDFGSIIATASMAAHINMAGSGAYSASKRAVCSMVEMSALELGNRGIRVNAVSPGYIDTALGSGDEGRRLCEAFTALGRFGTVEDVAGVFHFLASDDSRYISGQVIKVDGGWACGPAPQLLERVIGTPRVA